MVRQKAEAIFTDRGSKFIAYVYPVRSLSEIKPLVDQLKKEHPKANHHCWAVRLSPDRSVFKVNDDGEPSGTAGRPILNVMLSKDVTDALIVVVRYFGGKLLGVPGLINAYRTSAEMGLQAAGIEEKVISDIYRLTFDHVQMNDVMKVIKAEQATIIRQEADNRCTIEISVRRNKIEQTIGKLNGIYNLTAHLLQG
ncbi:YigZ family protein [Mucilaginibacter daejeonensis]|uniref:IMPACT family protein n=1 Tax=Mucilaginibacter daejeonensis TaxID=398049 RepID=UPI001D178206|nr:YigZ family protein [Mucilaginibacter daejeonensis]UEG55299.1 YigZ family protein [Mucilaginibacter daejeonensis]